MVDRMVQLIRQERVTSCLLIGYTEFEFFKKKAKHLFYHSFLPGKKPLSITLNDKKNSRATEIIIQKR